MGVGGQVYRHSGNKTYSLMLLNFVKCGKIAKYDPVNTVATILIVLRCSFCRTANCKWLIFLAPPTSQPPSNRVNDRGDDRPIDSGAK